VSDEIEELIDETDATAPEHRALRFAARSDIELVDQDAAGIGSLEAGNQMKQC